MLPVEDLLKLLFGKRLRGVTQKELNSKDRVIRFRARKKLIDNVFTTDFNDTRLSLIKSLYIFTLLRIKRSGKRKKFGEKILKKALNEENFTIAFEICQNLFLFSWEVEYKKEIQERLNKILDKLVSEHRIIENYIEVMRGEDFKDLQTVSKRSLFYHHYAKVIYYETRDYSKFKKSCLDALELFEGEKLDFFISKSFVIDIKEGRGNDNIMNYPNFVTSSIYNAVYLSYRQHYIKSIQVVQNALKVASDAQKELLLIIQAWQHLMLDSDFKLSKMLNDLTILQKQKNAENAGLILLKILYWFKKGDTDSIIDNSSSLKRYSERHVKGRVAIMYQFIFLSVKHSFNPPVREVEKLRLELDKLEYIDVSVEVVPFSLVIDIFFIP